jgi:hypothetical protein
MTDYGVRSRPAVLRDLNGELRQKLTLPSTMLNVLDWSPATLSAGPNFIVIHSRLNRRPRRSNSGTHIIGALADRHRYPIASLEPEIFSVCQEHEPLLSVMGDREWAFQRLPAEPVERLGHFGEAGGLGHDTFLPGNSGISG